MRECSLPAFVGGGGGLPAGLHPLRPAPRQAGRLRRHSPRRFRQHRRDQRPAHRQQGARARHVAARRRQGCRRGRAGGALGRGSGADRRDDRRSRPRLPGLAPVPRRQGNGDDPGRAAGDGLAGGPTGVRRLARHRRRLPLLLAGGAGRADLGASPDALARRCAARVGGGIAGAARLRPPPRQHRPPAARSRSPVSREERNSRRVYARTGSPESLASCDGSRV